MKWVLAAILASFSAAQGLKVNYDCPAADIDSFGLSCSPEEPCPVYLELSGVESAGAKVFVTGNLHTDRTTLYGILLASEDGGKSWAEPMARVRAGSLEQIEFLDFSHGWISGQTIEPLPRDPFLLITSDGGKTWTRKAIFEDARFGSISQFWFDSPTSGKLVVDHSGQREVYQTDTGGENWELEQKSESAVAIKGRNLAPNLRLRADGKSFHLERRGEENWEPVASFQIHVADCK